jgi:hypothetical protein
MEERPIFSDQHRKENVAIYFATNDAGKTLGFFEDFGLLLPAGSSIEKQSNCLIIDTPVYNLRIRTSCEGYSTLLPIDFAKYYLGFKKRAAKETQVQIEILKKPIFYFLPKQRKLFRQLIEFIDNFEESISYQNFLYKQNWEAICIQSRINESLVIKQSNGSHLISS